MLQSHEYKLAWSQWTWFRLWLSTHCYYVIVNGNVILFISQKELKSFIRCLSWWLINLSSTQLFTSDEHATRVEWTSRDLSQNFTWRLKLVMRFFLKTMFHESQNTHRINPDIDLSLLLVFNATILASGHRSCRCQWLPKFRCKCSPLASRSPSRWPAVFSDR